MINISDKICRENQNIFCSGTFFFENFTISKIMGKITVERGMPQITIWSIRIACRIPKAPETHTEYVMFIVFALQQLLLKCPSKNTL